MAIEGDAEHVIDFALQPVGGWPDLDRGADVLAVLDLRFHPHALVVLERVQDVHDVELRLALGIVNCGDVHAVIEELVVAHPQ